MLYTNLYTYTEYSTGSGIIINDEKNGKNVTSVIHAQCRIIKVTFKQPLVVELKSRHLYTLHFVALFVFPVLSNNATSFLVNLKVLPSARS